MPEKKMPPRKKTSIARSKAFVKRAEDFFGKLKDHEFYGPKVQHIFLYGEITPENLEGLSRDILIANREGENESPLVNPRPIVIHINSPGGYVADGLAMRAILSRSRVPVCALVEGMSASASTFVSIFAPYRVMCEDAVCLIHQYSAWLRGQANTIHSRLDEVDTVYRGIVEDYLQHTKISEKEIREMLKHDMYMDAKWAISRGVADRVISPDAPPGAGSQESLIDILQSTTVNHVVLQDDTVNYGLANSMFVSDIASVKDPKNVIVRPTNGSVFDTFDAVALSNHVRAIPSQSFLLMDSSFLDLVTILPLLFCSRRAMYTHATLNVDGSVFIKGAHLLEDVIHNSKLNFSIIKSILKRKTKLPDEKIESLKSARTFFTAEDCLKYGIVDELIDA